MRYGTVGNPEPSSAEKVRARFTWVKPNQQIDAWGMARSTGVDPLVCERVLDDLVREGEAVKEGSWYGPSYG